MEMEVQYNRAINPWRMFNNPREVKEFMDIDPNVEDLKCFLEVCEEYQFYEACSLIRDRISLELKKLT